MNPWRFLKPHISPSLPMWSFVLVSLLLLNAGQKNEHISSGDMVIVFDQSTYWQGVPCQNTFKKESSVDAYFAFNHSAHWAHFPQGYVLRWYPVWVQSSSPMDTSQLPQKTRNMAAVSTETYKHQTTTTPQFKAIIHPSTSRTRQGRNWGSCILNPHLPEDSYRSLNANPDALWHHSFPTWDGSLNMCRMNHK